MKTISLKKVSAVAVASLGFGLLSVVPASAAVATETAIFVGTTSGTTQTVYTKAGTEVVTSVYATTTAASGTTAAQTLTFTPTVACAGTVATTCTGGLTVGTAASGKAGMTLTGLATGTSIAAGGTTADKWATSVTSGVTSMAWTSGTIAAIATQKVGELSMTPTIPGIYTVTLTPDGTAGTESAVVVTLKVSGIAGTVAATGVGTAAITATTGGEVKFEYFTPNDTTALTPYIFTSTGVGRIVGGTSYDTAHAVDGTQLVVPYNGSTGDYSAGARWTTKTSVTTPTSVVLTANSPTAGVQTVSVTKLDATTGSPVAVTSIAITWAAGTSLDLTTLQVSTLPGDDTTNCTVANKANVAHNSVTRVAATDVANGGATDAQICVIAMNGNGVVKALYSLTAGTAGPGLVGLTAVGGAAGTTYGLGSVSADLDGETYFNTAGSLISGAATYLVTAKALNADGVTYTTLTGTVTVSFIDSKVATATVTQLKYALDDGEAAVAVANFVLADKAKQSMAGGATSNLLVDSDVATTLVVDAAGETDASAAVTVSTATSVAADGTVTKGVISVDCTATAFEKLTIWMHYETNTVASNKITVYCTNNTVKTLEIGAINATAGSSQKITATATAGITGKLSYPTADSATATFSSLTGTLSSIIAVNFENGVATVNYATPTASGKATIKVVPSDVATVVAFADGVTKEITIAASGDLAAITTLVDSLNAKIVALNALIAKIMKKLGVK